MTDAVSVFPAGFRVTDDATGAPVSGAIISFFDAGTTSPKTVYSDEDLTIAIGTTITCDALGYPTSDGGSTKILLYVGTPAYKVSCTDADGVPLWSHDNVKGAVVSADSQNVSVTATFPVVTKSLDYAVVKADQNTTFAINCSAGDVALTLPSAVTVGQGWKIKVQHAGAANQAVINVATGSGQLISEGSKSFGGSFSLALNGEDIEIASDGGNWRVSSHTSPLVKVAQGVIPITDRVSAAPSTPVQGAIYMSTSAATWAGVSVANNDVVQWSGAAWVPVTPYADCGWLAYVADENVYYRFIDSAWVMELASATQPGTLRIPTQAVQEAATTNDTAVTPGTQQFHPSACKGWAFITVSGGVPTLAAGDNVSSIVDSGVGKVTVNWTVPFANANYAVAALVSGGVPQRDAVSAGSATVSCANFAGNLVDPSSYSIFAYGDQ